MPKHRIVATIFALVGGAALIGSWGASDDRVRRAVAIGGLVLMLASLAITFGRKKKPNQTLEPTAATGRGSS